MRALAPLKDVSLALWGQIGPPVSLPAPADDLGRDVPKLTRPEARASWQPLTADIGNPWFRVPQEQNLRLFEQLVETIPVLGRALRCLSCLVGRPVIEAEGSTKAEIDQWREDVVVSRICSGFNNWLSCWVYDCLLYGRSHAELILPANRRDIYAIQELHPRTIDLRPTGDGYSLDIVQIMAMRGMWVTLNKRLIVTAVHDLAVDMPHGRSLLYGLPFVGEIFTSMMKNRRRLEERFGNPSYHVRYLPPKEMPDPTGNRSQGYINAMMNLWDSLMKDRANGEAGDFGTAGDVEVRVIGAAGETLDFVAPLREIISQIIAKTGLPPFLLGMQWQTTETMSAVEGGLVSELVDEIRRHIEPEILYLIRLRQLLAGKSPEFKIRWEAPTLIDLFETARAELFQAKAEAQKLTNAQDLWRLGIETNLRVAREFRPDLAEKTDEELRAALPDLLDEPPAPAPVAPGFGEALAPDQAGGGARAAPGRRRGGSGAAIADVWTRVAAEWEALMTKEQMEMYATGSISHEENIRSLGLPCSMAGHHVPALMTEAELQSLEFYADGPSSADHAVKALIAEVRRLRAALKRYGRHDETCGRAHYDGAVPCRCGLDDVTGGEQ